MDLGIRGRTAMVAAASKGIGYAIARALLREECAVSICARSPEPLQRAQEELRKEFPAAQLMAQQADVTRKQDLERWFRETEEKFGKIDILVTNTGGPPVGQFQELEEERWRQGVESTLMNVVRLTRLVLPGMQQRKWGRIVHITSLVAREPLPILTISSTLRAGLSALTRTQAHQFAPYGITVNAVLPGHILTDRQIELNEVRARQSGRSLEEVLREAEQEIPLRRFGKPDEIGDAVAFLCSERAGYITGISLLVDGGVVKGTF